MKLRIQITLVAALAASAAVAVPPGYEWAPDPLVAPPTAALSSTPCIGGTAGPYPCERVDLLAFLPLAQMGCVGGNPSGNDIWGWTDPLTGKEYALMGCHNGTSFVDLSDPTSPVYIGRLPTQTINSSWRDIKVYADHALVVSEASNHGLQVFDLNELRDVTDPSVVFQPTAHLGSFSGAHNVAINEDSGFAYVVGAGRQNPATCFGGLYMVDIQTPANPTPVGCFSADGYTHDTQCVIYQGPDANYQGREICFNSNEDTLTIVDVTDKSAPVMLGRETYPGVAYAHQGWLTEDHQFFLLDDESDEPLFGHNTRTRIWDVSDLESPVIIGVHDSTVPARDHNQYVKGSYVYQSNYTAGLRILDLSAVAAGELTEVAYFDTYPTNDNPAFNGSWSNYPYFDSGIVIASGMGEGLFVLQPDLPAGVIEGVVTRADTAAPLEGAEVQAVGVSNRTATSGPDGSYEIAVPVGTYDVTASLDGYLPETESGIEVSEDGTVAVDFALEPKSGGKTHLVIAQDFEFVPAELTIELGDTVQWDNVQGMHNVVADDGGFESGPVEPAPWMFTHTFDDPGDFPYFCAAHGAPGGVGMAGVITVVGAPQPELGFVPASLDFGQVEVGETSPQQSAMLQNSGEGAATGLDFNLSGEDGFAFDASACGVGLPAGGSCEVTVTFAPAAAGPAAATLQAASDEGATAALALAGTGVESQPELGFVPASLDFGQVEVGETSPQQSATLQNTGEAAATGLAFASGGADSFAFDPSACGGSLPAGASCEVTVAFTPAAAGPASATLQATTTEGASATLAVGGTGVEPQPELGFVPASLGFGVVEVGQTSPQQSATLGNTGDAPATGLAFGLTGEAGFAFDASACGASLPVDGSCEVAVTFTPAGPGPAAATLTASSEQGASAGLALTGQGVAEGAGFTAVALEVDPAALESSDANRVLEPGEQVEVAPAWRNDDVEARDLTGTATDFTGPAGADYDLALDAANYGTLGAGQTGSCRDGGVCYQLGVTNPAVPPAIHWDASFEETLSDDTTKTWTVHIGESFSDVPRTSPFYRFVETLLHGGVTSGCTAFEYCPAAVNNRAQMAVFLLRALEGTDFAPPACVQGGEAFADVPATSPFCAWIEELARREVTGGCGAGIYCPTDPVNRAQMAVFLLRTLEGPAYTPPACVGGFADVPCTSPFAAWIEDLFARQVTGGCATGPPRYCPADPVSRAQMAVFLTATFDLTLYGP